MLKRLISAILLIISVKMSDLVPLGMLGATGFLVGYAIKKLVKVVLFFVGLFLLVLISLEFVGAIKIYYDKLGEAVLKALGSMQTVLPEILSILPSLLYSVSFASGFLLGLMKG